MSSQSVTHDFLSVENDNAVAPAGLFPGVEPLCKVSLKRRLFREAFGGAVIVTSEHTPRIAELILFNALEDAEVVDEIGKVRAFGVDFLILRVNKPRTAGDNDGRLSCSPKKSLRSLVRVEDCISLVIGPDVGNMGSLEYGIAPIERNAASLEILLAEVSLFVRNLRGQRA